MKKDKLFKSTICHEWGHCLQYLLGGYIKFVKALEVIDSFDRVDGHTHLEYAILCDLKTETSNSATVMIMNLNDVENISICLAGVIAEKICGYNKGIVKGTDKAKIRSITTDKKFIDEIYDDVAKNMTPFRTVLDYLTEKTLENYITNDTDREIDLIISKEDIMILLKEALIINGFDTKLLDKEGSNICKITKPILFSHD